MFKERDSLLSVEVARSQSLAVQDAQEKIKGLYGALMNLDLRDEVKANELIRTIRRLEQEMVDIRLAQPGHYL